MTDYAKMARECQEELTGVERKLERARVRHPLMSEAQEVRMLEQMRMELRVKIREFSRRAAEQRKEQK